MNVIQLNFLFKWLKSSPYDPCMLGYTRVTKVKTKSCKKVI